jgi:hypothetical protein
MVDEIKILFRESSTHRYVSPSVSCLLHYQVIKFIEETGCRSKKLRKACGAAQKRIQDIKAASTNAIGDASAAAAVTEKTTQPSSGPT